MQTGALPALASQAFPARLRYSGASLGTQIPAIFAGVLPQWSVRI